MSLLCSFRWDIEDLLPGPKETKEALQREILEEQGCRISAAQPKASLKFFHHTGDIASLQMTFRWLDIRKSFLQ